ncbi:Cytochrome P450 [Metarhizium album ARSEF 1941]|uniref:Cytochrome P450 n=1 Tax=Metarhizium album (strain ARSEF 1941) TaxID=1081103 RepID=A0A0B2WD32_METAS|nr:Cytochrome P450 [Metarhizium album ARSEF 1941]KHN93731.1 Cytochrome P450 [Metarhizium album ARSEF 1941]
MAGISTHLPGPSGAKWGLLQQLDIEIYDSLSSSRYVKLAVIVLAWFWALSFLKPRRPRIPGAQVHGYRGWWEPSFLLKTRFIYDAYDIISSGYAKFKDVPFVVTRHDTDIHVLPMKYLDELRLVARNDLSGKMNLFRSWPWASVIRDSDLHVAVLTRKLNPEVSKYADLAHEELEYGWQVDVPKPVEWTEVDIQDTMRMLVARMSAKVFMGDLTCRDPKWLDLTLNFSMDLFFAGFALRMFPPWMHFLVKPLIPARWRVQKQIEIGTEVVRQYMLQREEEAKVGGGLGEGTLFEWMVDHAVGNEGSLEEMAARQCILTLASIHTTATTAANVLFDLMAYPEWVSVLRDEIDDTLETYGRLGEDIPVKSWLQHLEKMDSLIVESQRLNPPILLTPQRIALVPLTLKDGTHIPKGTRIAWAGPQHAFDPVTTPDPEMFNPMRSYHKRHANGGENVHKFMAGQSDPDNMSFGYGNQVCPGRYFAVYEIKLVLMRLLQEFDFEFPQGKRRPRSVYADENVILDPHAKVMMRKRKNVAPFQRVAQQFLLSLDSSVSRLST